MTGTAKFSPCQRYRYSLTREWGAGPAVLFIGLNPSTADAEVDDPTIRRCIGFAKRWGYGKLYMANLYAWRATDPRELVTATAPVVSEPGWEWRNDLRISLMANSASLVIAAWGSNPGPDLRRPARVLRLVGACSALGFCKNGEPRHPLYMRADVEPVSYEPAPA